LLALPHSTVDLERIDGRTATLTTYRDELDAGDSLIVVQGFLRSWRFPSYIGSVGIGYMYAEGFIVGDSGGIREANEDLVWPFR
jgi:hypothetical protein